MKYKQKTPQGRIDLKIHTNQILTSISFNCYMCDKDTMHKLHKAGSMHEYTCGDCEIKEIFHIDICFHCKAQVNQDFDPFLQCHDCKRYAHKECWDGCPNWNLRVEHFNMTESGGA